jgi:hypothetical protein
MLRNMTHHCTFAGRGGHRLQRLVVAIAVVALWWAVSAAISDAQTSPLTVQPSTNRVGIGTTTPTQTLDVNGTVKATTYLGDGSQLTHAGKVLISTGGSLPPDSATSYHTLQGTAWSATESQIQWITPIAGTIGKLYVYDSLGSGQSLAITLRKNGADQPLTCTIGASQSTCSDITHTFSVVAGDRLSIKAVSVGSLATQNRRFSASMLLTP